MGVNASQFPSCDSPIHPGPVGDAAEKDDDFRSQAAAVRCWVLFLNKSLPTAMEAPQGHESSGSGHGTVLWHPLAARIGCWNYYRNNMEQYGTLWNHRIVPVRVDFSNQTAAGIPLYPLFVWLPQRFGSSSGSGSVPVRCAAIAHANGVGKGTVSLSTSPMIFRCHLEHKSGSEQNCSYLRWK